MSIKSMAFTARQIQQALNKQGYGLVVDGVMGPKTEAAIADFKGKHGFRKRAYIGPKTAKLLFGDAKPRRKKVMRFTRHGSLKWAFTCTNMNCAIMQNCVNGSSLTDAHLAILVSCLGAVTAWKQQSG